VPSQFPGLHFHFATVFSESPIYIYQNFFKNAHNCYYTKVISILIVVRTSHGVCARDTRCRGKAPRRRSRV